MITLIKNLFRKTRPLIRFYCLTPGVKEIFPIYPSSQLKRKFHSADVQDSGPSIKFCPGIRKISGTGWIVPAPADFVITPHENGIGFDYIEPFRFQTGMENPNYHRYIHSHGPDQTMPLLDDDSNDLKSVVKVETPWRVETSEDIVLLQLPVSYNNEGRFKSASGVLDTKYGYNINIQLFWNKDSKETLVRAGTPLCQLIPISRKHLQNSFYDVKIENAEPEDYVKERAFIYATNCVIMKTDTLSSRLRRTSAIMSAFIKGNKK